MSIPRKPINALYQAVVQNPEATQARPANGGNSLPSLSQTLRFPGARPLLLGLVLGFVLPCQLGAVSLEKISAGFHTIRQERIRARLEFLASPHFKGRATGSPEAKLTAAYIASVFQRNGLLPVAQSTDFIHPFQITRGLPQLPSVFEFKASQGSVFSFKTRKDFLPASWGPNASITGKEAVFVGYGVTAPDLNYDDYRGIDIQDKVAIMLSGVPKDSAFRQINRMDYGDPVEKSLRAAAQGSAGVVLILAPRQQLPSRPSQFRHAKSHLAARVDSLSIPVVTASFEVGERLIGQATAPATKDRNLDELKKSIDETVQPHSVPLNGRVHLDVSYRRQNLQGYNVVGRIPGSDPTLKDEFIILGAHHDHVGVGDDGKIFFGADDNASGTTALLELSEAFQTNRIKPRRSILLAAWAAEEIGLLGSRHYVRNPPVPLEKTAAMIQMDMIGRNAQHQADPVNHLPKQKEEENRNSLNVFGASFTPMLRTLIERSNAETGLDLNFPSDLKAIDLNRRSDHWPFLQNGVCTLFLFTGFHPDYHRPTDTADKINFSKLEKILKLVYLTVWEVGEAKQPLQLDNGVFERLTYRGAVRE